MFKAKLDSDAFLEIGHVQQDVKLSDNLQELVMMMISVGKHLFVLQGRRKQKKVGWDNFEIHFVVAKNFDKSKFCITKREQNFHFGDY